MNVPQDVTSANSSSIVSTGPMWTQKRVFRNSENFAAVNVSSGVDFISLLIKPVNMHSERGKIIHERIAFHLCRVALMEHLDFPAFQGFAGEMD